MTKREGFKSLAERLNPMASELGLVVEADKMFAELERRIASLESDSHPPIDLATAMDEILDMRGYAPKSMLDPKTSGPEVTRQPLDDEWIKTVREAISTPAEPEVTPAMIEAGGAWISEGRCDRYAQGHFNDRLTAERTYKAMRRLEPKRPVEITEETVVRAHMAYVMTRDATSESPPRRVMVAMRAALEAALNPPNEGETR